MASTFPSIPVSEAFSRTVRVFIIDDHPLLRDGLRRLLEESGFLVCGEADDGKTAIPRIAAQRPDLVTIDISLPGTNGIELIKDLRRQFPELNMLVISMHDESLYAERVLRAGARGYIMKQEPTECLIEAIRQVLRDQIYLSPKLSAKLLKSIMSQRDRRASTMEALSDREFEIIQLMGRGFATGEIARELGISGKTVESHRGKIRQKLNLKSGAELVRYAMANAPS